MIIRKTGHKFVYTALVDMQYKVHRHFRFYNNFCETESERKSNLFSFKWTSTLYQKQCCQWKLKEMNFKVPRNFATQVNSNPSILSFCQ